MAVSSAHENPPQTHPITTIIVIQVDAVMDYSPAQRAASEMVLLGDRRGRPDGWRIRRNSPRKVATGGWSCKRTKSVLELNQDLRQKLGQVIHSSGEQDGRDRRLGPEILYFDPELDR